MRLLALLFLTACTTPSDACNLANSRLGCPECFDGDVTCSLDGVTVTEGSCGDCQARQALYVQLCATGSTATEEEIAADGVCGDPVRGSE